MLVLYHVDKTLYLIVYTVKPCYLEHHATKKKHLLFKGFEI